ncbi:hypothetical protein LIT25_16385 [Bacillus sp. F19]|nr:hypothetical protein LIT25_16385 [Bacillus sp. F19]
MELFIASASVFIMAALHLFEVYGVISIGILAGFPLLSVNVIAFLGNAFTVITNSGEKPAAKEKDKEAYWNG